MVFCQHFVTFAIKNKQSKYETLIKINHYYSSNSDGF